MISIIIPTIGRRSLFTCLDSIYSAYLAAPGLYNIIERNFEVIVVAKYLPQACMDELQKYEFVKYIEYHGDGNGPAKNHAAMFAKGEFLVFTDDDCVVDKDWLRKLYLKQIHTAADIVVGPCFPADIRNPYLIAHQGILMYYMNTLNQNCHNWDGEIGDYKASVGTSMNIMIRMSTFDCLGGFGKEFANQFGDDYDFNMRWKADETIKTAYSPYAIVYHNHQLTFISMVKLAFRYGIGLELCKRLNEIRTLKEVKVHPPFSDYKKIRLYIRKMNGSVYASWLAVLIMLVRRLGSWYKRHNTEAVSKVYDGV